GTSYHLAVKAESDGNSVRFPSDNLIEITTAEQTAFIRESLQISILFPGDSHDGLVASLSTPLASHPLLATIGDNGFSNRAFFNLSDFIDADTGTNLETIGTVPLTVHLHLPGQTPEIDDNPEIAFSQSFIVTKVTDFIFSGSGMPQIVSGFSFSEIGTQTARVPFEITVRALDAMGNPVTDFTGVAELAATGSLLQGAGTTAAFVDGVLHDHLVAIDTPGEYSLTVELPDGSAQTTSDSFVVAGSFDQWLLSQFPDPDDQHNPDLIAPDADPWGTGIFNLLAYGTGIDPQNPDLTRLPSPQVHEIDDSGERYLAITFARQKGTSDLDFIPEVSDSLGSWNSGSEFTEQIAALDQGNFEWITVRDRQPIDDGNRRFMRLRVRSQDSFAAWQARYFHGNEITDPEWSGADASPLGDGITNLMRYALGLAPHEGSPDDLPQETSVAVDDETYLTLSYVRPKDRTDIEYIIEVSENQIDWYPGGSFIETLFEVDRGMNELIIVRDIRPLGEEEQRSLRLNVRRR
ncbi:MAG TPA: hypothetical protein VK041_08620, partial [Opitutales bacterium]|nr:hypothetical protein [Opitutales bacterium]